MEPVSKMACLTEWENVPGYSPWWTKLNTPIEPSMTSSCSELAKQTLVFSSVWPIACKRAEASATCSLSWRATASPACWLSERATISPECLLSWRPATSTACSLSRRAAAFAACSLTRRARPANSTACSQSRRAAVFAACSLTQRATASTACSLYLEEKRLLQHIYNLEKQLLLQQIHYLL